MAKVLRANIGQILAAWIARVHDELPAAHRLTLDQLHDDVPDMLALVADAMEYPDEQHARELIERLPNHGSTRFGQGYNESELLIEFRLLRQVVIERVAASMIRPMTTDEYLAIDAGIDVALHQSLMAFINYQRAKLSEANDNEARFLTYVSHDMRNNLSSLGFTLEVLKRRLAGSKEFQSNIEDLAALEQSVHATMGGMTRLLHAEHLRHGSADRGRREVPLQALASAVTAQFGKLAAAKGLLLAVDVPTDAVVRSDRELLYIVLQNLIHNAVKYSTSGTVLVRGVLPAATEPTRWLLSVRDDGPGIAPEYLEKIFEHFRRGDAPDEPGTGLGLAIAARAARLLDIEISVHSEPGSGSTFSLRFLE